MPYLYTPLADLHPPKKLPCDSERCKNDAVILTESITKQRMIWCLRCWNLIKDIQYTEKLED